MNTIPSDGNENARESQQHSPAELVAIIADALKVAFNNNEALLLDAPDAAAFVGIKKSLWYRLHSEGKVPKPTELGKRILWRRDELLAWAAAGCPCRKTWEESGSFVK